MTREQVEKEIDNRAYRYSDDPHYVKGLEAGARFVLENWKEPYWHTGTPTEEGEYLCKLRVATDKKEIIRKSIETFMVSEDPEIGQFGGWLTNWDVLAWHRIEE